MEFGAQTTWRIGAHQDEIDAAKRSCLARLGIEMLPHLLNRRARIAITETTEKIDIEPYTIASGPPRTEYTLRAVVRFD